MAEFVTKIRTADGDKEIDYRYLAHKPESDNTLSVKGGFADAKAVGEKIAELEEIQKNKADKTYVTEAINALQVDASLSLEGKPADAKAVGDEIGALKDSKADQTYVDEQIQAAKEDTANIDSAVATLQESINVELELKADKEYVNTIISVPVSTAEDDNGKFLRVVNGAASWEFVPNAEELVF